MWNPNFIWVLGKIYWVLLQHLLNKSRKWYWATPILFYWKSYIGGLLEMLLHPSLHWFLLIVLVWVGRCFCHLCSPIMVDALSLSLCVSFLGNTWSLLISSLSNAYRRCRVNLFASECFATHIALAFSWGVLCHRDHFCLFFGRCFTVVVARS
jgi:hypothetical protein